MTIKEFHEKLQQAYAALAEEEEYEYFGLRFEDKERELGEVCETSKHNPDREDERDFPAYGTEAYDELPELAGTSAYDLSSLRSASRYGIPSFLRVPSYIDPETKDASGYHARDHAYIIASNRCRTHDDADEYEIVLVDAVVVCKLF
jgi:hypothetical protein